jgi:hypothetical protein
VQHALLLLLLDVLVLLLLYRMMGSGLPSTAAIVLLPAC